MGLNFSNISDREGLGNLRLGEFEFAVGAEPTSWLGWA